MKKQVLKPAPMCIVGPKRRTVAFRAIALLQTLGGSATPEQLLQVLPQEYRSIKKIIVSIALLQDWQLVTFVASRQVEIAARGCEFLQERGVEPSVLQYEGEIVPVREVPAFKPMCAAAFSKMMSLGPKRDGMDDLRTAPSLMGSTRVLSAGDRE